MIIALQMDPIESINVATDSSFMIGLEAQRRGFQLFCYQPQNLSLSLDGLKAYGCFVTLFDNSDHYYKKQDPVSFDLRKANIVWVRQDPPFNLAYISSTYLLDALPSSTLVLNNPKSIRDYPEKLLPFQFQDFMAPTLITRNVEDFYTFFETHQDIVLKPLYGAKGHAVIRLQHKENLGGAIDLFEALTDTPFIMQKFIPEVKEGDKRILFVDGDVVGAFKRIPQTGYIRSNIVLGGTAELSDLTDKEQKLAKALGSFLKEKGLFLAGIDVIGDYLTEINITSPTGYALLNKLNNQKTHEIIWDKALSKYTKI